MQRTSLYRHFDTSGRLLYVGISKNHVARLGQHKGRSSWFWDISRVEVQHFSSRDDALLAEAQAIECENPLHNRMTPVWPKPNPRPIVFKNLPALHSVHHPCAIGIADGGDTGWLLAEGVPRDLIFTNVAMAAKAAQHSETSVLVGANVDISVIEPVLAERSVSVLREGDDLTEIMVTFKRRRKAAQQQKWRESQSNKGGSD